MALPDYLQEAGKDFAKQLTAQTAVPIDTSTFTGRQFVAGEDPLQTQAINLATQGIGSFQPFLQQTAITQAGQDSRTWTVHGNRSRDRGWINRRFYITISTTSY